jgi:hypothetical protein
LTNPARSEHQSEAAIKSQWLGQKLITPPVIGPKTIFKAMPMLPESHGQQADFNVGSPAELPGLPLLHRAEVAK